MALPPQTQHVRARFYLARSLHGAADVLLSSMDQKRHMTCDVGVFLFYIRAAQPYVRAYKFCTECAVSNILCSPQTPPLSAIVIARYQRATFLFRVVSRRLSFATCHRHFYNVQWERPQKRYFCEGLTCSNHDPNTPNARTGGRKVAGDRRGVNVAEAGTQQFGGTRMWLGPTF